MLRNRVIVAIFLIGLLQVSTNSWAQSGQLNSENCHHETVAEAYHCHRSNCKSIASYSITSVSYNRDNWEFRSSASPVTSSVLGWYTGIDGSATDVDHVVALKDAYISGGHGWNGEQKRVFANDLFNHVAAVPYVNRTLKNEYVPLKFIIK